MSGLLSTTPVAVNRVEPVLPVHDLDRAMRFYERLGFAVRSHDAGYGYADRDGLRLHLRASPELDLYSSYSEVYVDTADVDALHAQWQSLGLQPVAGNISPELQAELRRRAQSGDAIGLISERVEDKPWGVREFSLRDPDNNQLRFGRPRDAAGG
jgi:catechol 2,3-dioxygenase-like lactoylglutathione lyase family enzyme